MLTNGITTIFFDLDGTLRTNDPRGDVVFWNHAVSLGAPGDPQHLYHAHRWEHCYWADSPELLGDFEKLGRDTVEFWLNYSERFLQAMGCPAEQARALAPLMEQHMAENWKPLDVLLDGVQETLGTLKAAGFRLGVITNRAEPINEYMQELGIASHFDLLVTGGEVKVWKPAPGIFEAALERAQARPEQALYVGDNYYADALGASGVGIQPVLLDPDGHFPEAECPVIRNMGELLPLMQQTYSLPN